MTIQYNIYANQGTGGPVDYSAPIGTTTSLSFQPPPLQPGSDWIFAVRAEDVSSGLEEKNTDARVEVILDGSGHDISARPGAPVGLSAEPIAGAGIRVRWLRSTAVNAAKPVGYRVYLGSPAPDYATAAAVVMDTGSRDYVAEIPGLVDGRTYQVGVRAYNQVAEEPNTVTVAVTADASPPQPVDGLTVTPTY